SWPVDNCSPARPQLTLLKAVWPVSKLTSPSLVCERFCFCHPQTDLAQLARPCLPFAASDQMSTWRASNFRLRRQPRVQSRSNTGFAEFGRVAITQFDLDPTIFDGLVQPSLEIGISHIDEIIASKYAARTNFMLHENVEDLASHFFIRCQWSSAGLRQNQRGVARL